MNKSYLIVSCLLVPLVGCAVASQAPNSLPSLAEQASVTTEAAAPIKLVDYEETEAVPIPEPVTEAKPLAEDVPAPDPNSLTLEVLEQMALSNHPATAQAAARVRALRGKWCQVGLAPNPTIGYMGSEIGNEGQAGQQGAFAGQQFITAGKLSLNRAVVSAEIQQAEQVLAATQMRVQTDIRQKYYLSLVAQRRVEVAQELVRINAEAVDASKNLVEAEEIPIAGLLQTEVEHQNATIILATARNKQSAAWRKLSAVVGNTDLPPQPLVGDVTTLPNTQEWDAELARLTSSSPEVAAAMSGVSRARRALARACVEAVPDINTQLSVQYDDATTDTVTGIQVGLPLPLWNRNQGGIRQARAEISEANRNVRRIELSLKERLAETYQLNADAQTRARTYAQDILPRAERTLDLVQKGYRLGEVGYLDFLAAQRTYSQTSLAYVDALESIWQSWTQIEGLLLDDGLQTRPE